MRIRRAWILPAIGLLLGAPTACRGADEIAFTASVDRTRVTPFDRIVLEFRLENAGMGGGTDFRPPDLGAFHVLSGPNQSSSVQIVNGSISSSVTYGYVLQPRAQGKVTIARATVTVDGRRYATRPVSIDVVPGGGTGAAGGGQGRGDRDGGEVSGIAENLFLRASVDRDTVRQGAPIDVTFRIYTRLRVTDYGIARAPAFTGFWSVEIPVDDEGTTTEVIDGRSYRVGLVKHVVLFPNRSGTLEIPPLEVETVVQVPRRRSSDPFDAFFRDPFGRSEKYVLRTDPLTVHVDPLPAGAPEGFRGAVGEYRMKVALDRTEAAVGDPVTLRVAIEGTGNVELLDPPGIEIDGAFETYPPKVSKTVRTTGGRVSGKKTFEYLLIPRVPGTRTLDPARCVYFDLGLGRYVTLESKPIELTVTPGGPAGVAGGVARGDVQLLTEDIRFIHRGDPGLRPPAPLPDTGRAAAALLLPLAGLAALLYGDRRLRRARADRSGHRRRRASAAVRRRFRTVRAALRSHAVGDFYEELGVAVRKYASDKLAIDPGEFSIERMADALRERGVDPAAGEALSEILDASARASYAPGSADPESMERLFEKARRVVSDLERVL